MNNYIKRKDNQRKSAKALSNAELLKKFDRQREQIETILFEINIRQINNDFSPENYGTYEAYSEGSIWLLKYFRKESDINWKKLITL